MCGLDWSWLSGTHRQRVHSHASSIRAGGLDPRTAIEGSFSAWGGLGKLDRGLGRGETFLPDSDSDRDSDQTFQISRKLGLVHVEFFCFLDSQPRYHAALFPLLSLVCIGMLLTATTILHFLCEHLHCITILAPLPHPTDSVDSVLFTYLFILLDAFSCAHILPSNSMYILPQYTWHESLHATLHIQSHARSHSTVTVWGIKD